MSIQPIALPLQHVVLPFFFSFQARDQFQATALMLCAERGYTEMVDSLLGAGADTSAVDENGNTALHLACFYANREVVQLLLSVDVDVVVSFFFFFLLVR